MLPVALDMGRVPVEGGSISRHGRPDYRIDPETGCWEWLKTKNRGYPMCSRGRAHRAYYKLACGLVSLPTTVDVHHVCENIGCVNPAHMELRPHGPHIAGHQRRLSPLTAALVVEIRERRAGGESVNAIAADLELVPFTVYQIVIGRRWANAGGPITRKQR